ncbi:glycosyltransferase [Roseobacter sp. EG26]|uniref:glycosyltransferase n=1 Tax=Roseobacter sp. EG26 TaxID=3412477 RepID=UPI003CE587FB
MILLCSGEVSAKHFDALLMFAALLESCGHNVTIDARYMPEDVLKPQKYEAVPFLVDPEDISADTVLAIGAEAISRESQVILRSLNPAPDVSIRAIGCFADYQGEINARNKIADATGRDPTLHNLNGPRTPALLEGACTPLVTRIAAEPEQSAGKLSRVLVYVPCDDLEDQNALNALAATSFSPTLELHVLTNAKGKDLIRRSRHAELSVFGYSELPPADIVNFVDVIAFFGTNVPGERMAALTMAAMGAGKVVIDCTTSSGFANTGAPVIKGPEDISVFSSYLHEVVTRNRLEIGHRTLQSTWLKQFDLTVLERDLEITATSEVSTPRPSQIIFFPTNGNGLGHAQRCALIAEAMPNELNRRFAAFPSCIDMLENRGFECVPMISRSAHHTDEYAADLVNSLRLRNLLRAGDRLVFDGGYVFDSVYRTILSRQLSAVWIRRGLWRPGQINPTALERERAFSQIIVPQEAFAELNADYSTCPRVEKVGPIVRQTTMTNEDRQNLRDRLSVEFDQTVDTLAVTMLGGGVASDRTSQTQLLCSLFEQRPNCLHLIVAWPNARISSGLYGWKNSHVVQTSQTLALCQAADLTVSAVGYNSFHELLYAQVPAILIPQSAPYLDDQERRARAAADRGLAALVAETDLLTLEREVFAFLEGDKVENLRKALGDEVLPALGNQAAATLIEQGGSQ